MSTAGGQRFQNPHSLARSRKDSTEARSSLLANVNTATECVELCMDIIGEEKTPRRENRRDGRIRRKEIC